MDFLGICVAVARGLHIAALISACGVLIFHATVWREPVRPPRLNNLLIWSLCAAILTAFLWMLLQSAQTSGAGTLIELVAAVPIVATSTTFGHALLLRLALLLAAVAVLRWRPSTSSFALLAIVGLALVLQSGLSHAIAQDDWTILTTHALHVLAAGAWLGALLPLWLILQSESGGRSATLLVRFSYLGIACVAVLLYTAYVQFFGMIGGLPTLAGTDYGRLAVVKAVILLVLLLCAALNRIIWTPRQFDKGTAEASGGLKLTVAAELVVGLAMVAAASSLASTPPAIHEQADWPFSVQFDIAGFYYPPMWDKIERSIAAIVAALLLIVVGFLVRRFVWVPFAAASLLLLMAPFPKTDILFKPAHPQTFYVSPSTFPVASIARGADIFQGSCANCHDPRQRIIPPFSEKMPVIPPALNTSRVARLRDGNLFWAIAHGIDDPRGGQSMPGFGDELSDDDIWNVIDYLRALSAPSRGGTAREVRAPSFNVTCPNGEAISSAALRGKVVRLVVANGTPVEMLAAQAPSETVVLSQEPVPSSKFCTVQELEAWSAYAVIAGASPEALPGAVFLIDANGWLRYAAKQGAAPQSQIEIAEEIFKKPLPRDHSMHDH